MSKVFALAFAVAALAAFVSQANAGRHRGGCCAPTCCETATPCCGDTAAAPAPTADNNAHNDNAANNTAQSPQSTRSFSYQPSTNNTTAPRAIGGGRSNFGVRDAASKPLGNY